MTTIYDIAKECKCSPATVSKVFNGNGNISDERKRMIYTAAKKLGYYPNETARSLVTKRSNTLGVMLFISDDRAFTHELFSEILNSFRIEAEKSGYDITFISQRHGAQRSYLEHCMARSMDGVFCVSCNYDFPEIQELIESEIPVVCFDYYGDNALSISTDNVESMAEIVDHLASLGHRKITFVTGQDVDVTRKRIEGFRKGLLRNGIEFEEGMLLHGSFYLQQTVTQATQNALKSGYPFTAIIYPDDYTAIAGVKELKKFGFSVPKDISVVGYDGVEVARITRPSITTIGQNTHQIGTQAAAQLIGMIGRGGQITDHLYADFKFVQGESTAKCNDR